MLERKRRGNESTRVERPSVCYVNGKVRVSNDTYPVQRSQAKVRNHEILAGRPQEARKELHTAGIKERVMSIAQEETIANCEKRWRNSNVNSCSISTI